MTKERSLTTLLLFSLVLALTACGSKGPVIHSEEGSHAPVMAGYAKGEVPKAVGVNAEEEVEWSGVDLRTKIDMDAIIDQLEQVNVVYVGETHDLYGHHLAQLEVIKRLHKKSPDLAIGMEMFQQPFQSYLDAFVSGEIDQAEMLRKTEWFDRWRYDYRHYKPILDFARENGLPIIALNIPVELKDRVSKVGVEGLSDEERAQIPADMDDSDTAYRERLRKVFHRHDGGTGNGFDRFEQVQLLWDESMAERAARFLSENPGKKLVVLAGGGHLMYGSGIPNRVKRRVGLESAIILPGDKMPMDPAVADFLIYPPVASLPSPGLMGVYLAEAEHGVLVGELAEASAAATAGIKKDDVITRINDAVVKTPGDVKALLMGKPPGEVVKVRVHRAHLLFEDEDLDFEFELGN